MCHLNKSLNIITTHFDVLAGMDEVKVDKHYFDIEIDENDTIISDYKIKPVRKKCIKCINSLHYKQYHFLIFYIFFNLKIYK
jgi:hypothetical protein